MGIPEKWAPGPGASTGGTLRFGILDPKMFKWDWDPQPLKWDPISASTKYSSGTRDN